MEKRDLGIVYMGTPDFAVEPLRKLVDEGYNVKAVVTVADKPSGRGLKMHPSPVKTFAVDHAIPVLQPLKLSDPLFLDELTSFNADLFIVVAFRKLPESVWSMPPLGCFNLHASLLPQYRGAAPINHAIMNGEIETGVTTFFLNNEIDSGKIIMQRKTHIEPDESAGELHDRLMKIGAELVIDTVNAIKDNSLQTVEQPDLALSSAKQQHSLSISEGKLQSNLPVSSDKVDVELKKAPKIFRDDCRINWSNQASSVHNFIRGLSPYPASYAVLLTSEGEKEIKVLKSALTEFPSQGIPGSLIIQKEQLFVECQDGVIELLTIQPSGKKAMSVSEFLRGNRSEILSFK